MQRVCYVLGMKVLQLVIEVVRALCIVKRDKALPKQAGKDEYVIFIPSEFLVRDRVTLSRKEKKSKMCA